MDTKKVNHLHDNNVNTEAKPRSYRVILLDVPLNCPGQSLGNFWYNCKFHHSKIPITQLLLYEFCQLEIDHMI